MPKVSEAHREAMRDHILSAAADVLSRNGVNGTTIRDIVAEADIAPATLYAYFDGKDAILEALTGRLCTEWLKEFEERSQQQSMEAFLEWMFGTAPRESSKTSVLSELRGRMSESEGSLELVRRVNNLMVAMVRPVALRMVESGALAVDDLDAYLEYLDILFDGIARRAASQSFVTSGERVWAFSLDLLTRTVLMDAAVMRLGNDEVPTVRQGRASGEE
jgi:AcrR family transcriptional regulator